MDIYMKLQKITLKYQGGLDHETLKKVISALDSLPLPIGAKEDAFIDVFLGGEGIIGLRPVDNGKRIS